LTALASTDSPPTLEDLEVFCEGDDLSRLLMSPALANLRRFNLQQSSLADDDLERLARSPMLAQISRLAIQARHGVERGLTALFSSPHLGRLTRLEVGGCRLSMAAAEALASNPNRGRLRTLSLPDLDHGRDPPLLAVLTGGEPFPELHTLRLRWWRPPPRAALLRAFLQSPKLPRLCVVQMDDVANRDADVLADVFRPCERTAWAGGEMRDGGDGVRISLKPTTPYLPHHLDDF
jgi:hypothetical protein